MMELDLEAHTTHAAHATHVRRCWHGSFARLFCYHGLGSYKQAGDRRCILQSSAHNLCWIDNTGLIITKPSVLASKPTLSSLPSKSLPTMIDPLRSRFQRCALPALGSHGGRSQYLPLGHDLQVLRTLKTLSPARVQHPRQEQPSSTAARLRAASSTRSAL